jgi:hypothetical protein
MLALPIPLLISWLIGLFSLALLPGSMLFFYLAVRRWFSYDRLRRRDGRDSPELSAKDRGVHRPVTSAEALNDTAILTPLILGTVLLLFTFVGRSFVKLAFSVGDDEPTGRRTGTAKDLTRPDGTKIHAELYGSPDAPTLVLTHGWGTNSN